MEALISLYPLRMLPTFYLIATDLQARQAWDFKKWMHQVSGLDLSICEISCLQLSHEKFSEKIVHAFAWAIFFITSLASDVIYFLLRSYDV